MARARAALQDLMRELDAMPHTPSLSQLQHPEFAVVNGELVAYDDVKVHISAEALTRALSVFEGMKGYWDLDSQEFGIRSPRQHYERLRRSATVLHIPVDFSYDEFRDSCLDLARALLTVDRDMWFRTTMYVVEGHWGEGTRADLVVTGFHQTKDPIPPMSLTVSSWRRSGDAQLPYRVKASANYVVARQARIEASERGFDDAILLNDAGRVAEATGSCVVALRDGVVVTPPHTRARWRASPSTSSSGFATVTDSPSSDGPWIEPSSLRAMRPRSPARSQSSRRSLGSIPWSCVATECCPPFGIGTSAR